MIDISGSTADGCLSLSGEETLGYAGRRCRHRLIGPATRCYSLIHRLPLKLHSQIIKGGGDQVILGLSEGFVVFGFAFEPLDELVLLLQLTDESRNLRSAAVMRVQRLQDVFGLLYVLLVSLLHAVHVILLLTQRFLGPVQQITCTIM